MVNIFDSILKLSFSILFVIGLTLILSLESCEKEGSNETKISSYGSKESHKTGQNCMNCHQQGEKGDGWFTIAGTVYHSNLDDIYENATVRLYTGPNSTDTLIHTIEVDAKGNFYTTESIDFGNGLYTLVQGNNSTNHMVSKITNGQCNSCHGSSTDRIWTE